MVAGSFKNLDAFVDSIPTHTAPKKLLTTTSANNKLVTTWTNQPIAPISPQVNNDRLGALKKIAKAILTTKPDY